jgi:hypothetical protein
VRIGYRLVMEVLRDDGAEVGRVLLVPDWDPAIESTRLTGLRTLGVWAPETAAERAIDPLWHAESGEPYLRGFRVHLADRAGVTWHEDFSTRYFAGLARSVAARLVEKGALAIGERYRYRTVAYEHPDPAAPEGSTFTSVEQAPKLAVRDVDRDELVARSAPGGDTEPGDFDVFIPADVLNEASVLTTNAGDVETGGILIGHLGHGASGPEICVQITALIAARHTVSASTKLTFTSDTWTDVRRAVELRGSGELVLGWFHSHPQHAWCREKGCPLEQQQRCLAADGFLSADDEALHRTMFPRAFTIALLMTQSVKGIVPRLFGWRSGCLEPRGFRVQPAGLEGRAHASQSSVA